MPNIKSTNLNKSISVKPQVFNTPLGVGDVSASAKNAEKAKIWAEGTDEQVEALGGEHSAKVWAEEAESYATSENITTVATNIENINTVAGISSDVTQVAGISSAVSTVSSHDNEVTLVADNMASVMTTASNVGDIHTVAGIASDVSTVASNDSNVTAVAGNATAINTVSTNISDVTSASSNMTDIVAVSSDLTNINTVATNISDVNATGQAIADVSAVADNLTDISLVANDLENIDEVATKVAEWQKPEDWVDIRSGALDNSIYLLVAHSTPTESGGTYTVATYPRFIFYCTVSTSANTYDVYVDGVKITTATQGSTSNVVTIDWGALYTAGTVQTLYTTTHPSSLVYHVVRITPTVSTDKLTQFRNFLSSANSAYSQQGILWAHFQLTNAVSIGNAFSGETRPRNLLLEAVTAKNNKITYKVAAAGSNSGFYGAFGFCSSLVQIPVLEAENQTYESGVYLSFRDVKAKKVIIKNNKGTELLGLLRGTNIQEFDIENGVRMSSGTGGNNSAHEARNLKKLPTLGATQDGTAFYGSNFASLEDTFLDLSSISTYLAFRLYGSSTYKVLGLKGLVVSPSAPFTGDSPQINISYTGLNREALVALFNSLPTVSASQVCQITGAVGAADLTASDLAIATGKGWTITR